MKIERFDKVLATQVGKEAEIALREVAEKYGLQVQRGGGRYDGSSFTPKFTFIVPEQKEKDNEGRFKAHAKLFDCDPEWYGQSFYDGKKEFKVVGLTPRGKNVVDLLDLISGKTYRCPPGFVKKHLGMKEDVA